MRSSSVLNEWLELFKEKRMSIIWKRFLNLFGADTRTTTQKIADGLKRYQD